MALVDGAVYVDGRRREEPVSLEDTFEVVRSSEGMAWIGLYRPDQAELDRVGREFGLHPLAVEDAVSAHQRAKFEHYDGMTFTVLRPAWYVAETDTVEFGEIHVFTGENFVVTVRHAEHPDLHQVRNRLEQRPDLLALGPQAVLYAILDDVVDGYAPVLAALQDDIDEIENQLFRSRLSSPQRIYEVSREVIEFQRATQPLLEVVTELAESLGAKDEDRELARHVRDVRDHVTRQVDRADAYRALLQNALSVQTALTGQQQNEEMRALTASSLAQNEEVKKISAWAATLFAPTLVGTVYGMNFTHMPELDWRWGYPMAVLLMVASSVVLWLVFRHRRWL